MSTFSSLWCLECDGIPQSTCEASQHNILDRKEDVEGIKGLQKEVSTTLSQAIDKRKEIRNHLQTVIIANDQDLKKLQSLADNKQLSTNRKTGSFSIKKKLKDSLQKAKEEVKKADKSWNYLTGGSVISKVFFVNPPPFLFLRLQS